jgi:protein Tex
VKVRVTEVDLARKRIALSMKLDAPATGANRRDGPRDNRFEGAPRGQRAPQPQALNTAMAGAFAKLQGSRK